MSLHLQKFPCVLTKMAVGPIGEGHIFLGWFYGGSQFSCPKLGEGQIFYASNVDKYRSPPPPPPPIISDRSLTLSTQDRNRKPVLRLVFSKTFLFSRPQGRALL